MGLTSPLKLFRPLSCSVPMLAPLPSWCLMRIVPLPVGSLISDLQGLVLAKIEAIVGAAHLNGKFVTLQDAGIRLVAHGDGHFVLVAGNVLDAVNMDRRSDPPRWIPCPSRCLSRSRLPGRRESGGTGSERLRRTGRQFSENVCSWDVPLSTKNLKLIPGCSGPVFSC